MLRVLSGLSALLVALVATTPTFAGGGLPKLAIVQAGPYAAALQNDSPTLVTGVNAITVEIPNLPAGSAVSLALVGPNGTARDVPLKNVRILGSHGDGGHRAATDSHDDGKADDHGASAPDSHPSTDTASHGGHGAPIAVLPRAPGVAADDHAHEAIGYLARGTVKLPATGIWVAYLTIRDDHGARYAGEAALAATAGGPHRWYVGGVGTVIAGALLFGALMRLRQPARTVKINEARKEGDHGQ